MAVGIGYIIGTLYTGVWFIGALLSYVIIIPLGTALNLFPAVQDAVSFKNTLGIGLMVGTGIGVLLAYLISLLKKKKDAPVKNEAVPDTPQVNKKTRFWTLLGTAIAFVLTIACGIGPIPSFLLMLGVLLASAMAAIISGETGINPMEIFGIIVLLAVRLIVPVDAFASFFIAAAVAVACGYSGDMLFDYKAGRMLGTNPVAQMISQVVGGLAGAVIAALSMFAVVGQFGGVGPDKGLPAGQAFMVSQMINGVGAPVVFGIAVAIGALLYLLKVPVMTLGIGIYLPFEISAPMFLGGAIRFITDRLRPNSAENGNIAASGLLGGEGITGVGIAIFKMITGG
jgi:uncharacterized oligopeptide transporter (OPT) family protein